MDVKLTRIAEKKLKQMGATVHGVLAKNEVGNWVAVSEAGRVMWLDNFEGQASSAQPEPSSGVPEGWKLVPVEPTEAMIVAFERAPCAENYLDAATWAWEAMITAAPQPPQEGE